MTFKFPLEHFQLHPWSSLLIAIVVCALIAWASSKSDPTKRK